MKRILVVFLMLLPGLAFAQAGERILGYDSLITVHPAGDMTVTETIRVVSEGDRIRHGIYRDFPTRYKDRLNNSVSAGFTFLSASRDGAPEPWHTEERDNGVRVYLGSKGVTLDPGEYTYVLSYRTDRQLGFFDTHDELYWNVTGNGWEFPIDKARAVVELPPGAEVKSTEAYTGRQGERGADYVAVREGSGRAVFAASRTLAPGEGLTIVVAWPKGFVREPTGTEKARAFLADNGSTVAGAVGLLVVLCYYLAAWILVGRDPEKGVIIPLFEAPAGFSPAAVRYVMRMGFDDKAFAAAVVSMAVKGCITIDEDADGEYTLSRKGQDFSGLSRGEALVAKQLFRNGDSLAVRNENHAAIKKAIQELRKSLALEYEKIYFLTNKGKLIPGLVISVVALAIIVILGRSVALAGFMTVWLSGWTAGCALLVVTACKAWRGALTDRPGRVASGFSAVFLTVFSIPFLAGEGFGLWIFSTATSIPAVLLIFAIVLLNILFYHFMKAPTINGRMIMDRLEGLRLYLSVAEKDRLNQLNPPDKTPEVFERFLPYALALDVEHEWCEQFADVLEQARAGKGYAPGWYTGTRFAAVGAAGLASSLGSMSSSISSSSSPPGSSSGGGGGGSSGGGGGGGGGGGW